jgi:hypothetical protein
MPFFKPKYFLSGRRNPAWNEAKTRTALGKNTGKKVSYKTLENTKDHQSAVGIASRTLRA